MKSSQGSHDSRDGRGISCQWSNKKERKMRLGSWSSTQEAPKHPSDTVNVEQDRSKLNSDRTFRVMYCNAGSILNKIDELSSFALEHKPDLIAICETWGNENLRDCFFSIPDFEIVCRNDRKDTTSGIGGGLLIYAKDDMVGNVSKYESVVLDNFVQTSAVKVSLVGAAEVILVLLYRPHHIYKETVIQQNLTEENNEKLCDILQLIPKPYVMVGDLNYSNINWETMTSDAVGVPFLESVQDNFLSQHINFIDS